MSITTVLTSGTAGIGKEILLKVLKESKDEFDKIFLNYGHNDKAAQDLLNSISEESRKKIVLVKADMSSYEGIDILYEAIEKSGRSIDWLILNTGIGSYKKFEEYDISLWEKIMRTNLNVPLFLIKKLKHKMNNNGSVVLMGSHAGQVPYSSSLVYSVSKAAVLFMSKALVKVFEEQQVRVNAIAPGFIETNWQIDRSEESRIRINNKIALHRFGKPEEVAELCFHILSNNYLNGSIFEIHGGYDYF